MPPPPGSTPKLRIIAERARRGTDAFTKGCVDLLHAWDDAATEAIIHATNDDAWRVREMAGKVIAAHRVAGAFDAIEPLRADKVPRVRAAAVRAIVILTADGA